MRWIAIVWIVGGGALACSERTREADRAAANADAGGADAADARVDASDDDPCSIEALRASSAATTYYVAIEEPGADNEVCDGRAPTDEGGGHCPFRDFDSERTQRLLDGARSTRVALRRGTYTVFGWDGLRVTGTGTSEAERVVLSAYPGETPVLDVPAPDGAGCTEATAPDDPRCVRQVLRVSGRYTLVQGLTIRNGLGYHVEITGGEHHQLRCNTLGETVAFPMRSDCLKIDGRARDVEVSHNDFSRFRSQAIDMTEVFDVLIEDNDFHDPIDADAGATGVKLGAADITIRGNRVHDMGADTMMHAFSLGGTGTEHAHDHAAYRVRIEGNRVWNIAGILAQLVSCKDCVVEDNEVSSAGAGILLSSAATGSPECTVGAIGCEPNAGTRIAGNVFTELNGGNDPTQANVFVFVEDGEGTGLSATDNTYCVPSTQQARFGLGGALIDFNAWQMATGADATSRVRAADQPPCR